MSIFIDSILGDICIYINNRIEINSISVNNYVSTENMLPERGGIVEATSLPTGLTTSKFQKEDILISNIRPYFKKIWFSNTTGGCSNDVLVIRARENCSPIFLYYLLSNNAFFDYATQTAKGTKMPRGDKTAIMNYRVSLPPLPVQKKIAAILSSLDNKIELNTRMNKVLEEIARALFHRWFVEFEFPDAEGKPYKSAGGKMVESEMGMVPEGWRVGTIGELAKRIFSGGTPNTSEKEYWNGGIPWFSSGETRCHFVIDTEKTITKDGIENSSTKLAKKHDIVIASAGQGFTRGQTSYLLLDTYVNQSVIVIHGDISYQIYIYMSLSGRYDELRGISDSSSIRGSLTTKMIDKIPIFIPSSSIVENYAKVIQPIINRIENNLNENKRLTNIRDALLPKLMSGEIEV